MKKSKPEASHRDEGGEGLKPYPKEGPVPKKRVKDMKSLHEVYERFAEEDEKSAYNRSLVRDAAEGAPPYDEADIEQDGRYNLNFHGLRALLSRETARYTDLVESVDYFARFKLPENGVEDDVRSLKQDGISEEHAKLIKLDGDFNVNWNILTTELSMFAVCATYFPNEDTWKWMPAGLDDFLIPRQTKATESAIPIFFVRDRMSVSDLAEVLATGEKYAKGRGWNPEEVKCQLVKATRDPRNVAKTWPRYWAEVQDEIANNDYGTSYTKEQVDVVHAYVREFPQDGGGATYTHYIFPEDGVGDDFLLAKESRFKSADEAFNIFYVNLGRGGKIHSARGLLYSAYPAEVAKNRLRCAALDSTAMSMAMFLQPENAEDMEDMAIVLEGPIGWLPPGAKNVEGRNFPNLAQNALPIIADLDDMLNTNLGMEQFDTGAPSTKYGQKVQQVIEGTLSGTTISVFYQAWEKLLWQQFKRIQKIGPGNKKYPEVATFYENCERRGITAEDIQSVESLVAFRAAGRGSASMRLLAFDEAMQTIGMLDETGRHFLLRDRFAARFGSDLAERYVGSLKKPRFNQDQKFAELENAAIRGGDQIEPTPGENHAVHSQVHLMAAAAAVDQIEGMLEQAPDQVSPAQMEALGFIERLLQHTVPHVQELANDETRKELFGNLRKAFQQIEARWTSLATNLQRMVPTEADQQAQVTRLQMKMQEHQVKMQTLVEDAQVKKQLRIEDVQQRMALRRVQTGVKISQGSDMHRAKVLRSNG